MSLAVLSVLKLPWRASLEVEHVPKRDTRTLKRVGFKNYRMKDPREDRFPFLQGPHKFAAVRMSDKPSDRPTFGQHWLQDMNEAVIRQQSPQMRQQLHHICGGDVVQKAVH